VNYRRILKTTLSLSEIGFGCGGNAGLMVRGSDRDQVRIIAHALDLGINYFDNAPDYGDGAAEDNLGRALRALGQRPVITSKVEIRRENLDDIAGHVVRSCESSLQRLGVDHLDILQIHNGPVTAPPPLEGRDYRQLALQDFLRPDGVLEGLHRLKRAGKIKYAGFICRGDDGNEVRQLLDTGLFALINVPYMLLNPTAGLAQPSSLTMRPDFGGVINDAGARGVGCAIYSPLAGGTLTDDRIDGGAGHPLARKPETLSKDARRNIERAGLVRFLAKENDLSLAQAAYRFILMHEHVTTVVGGFSSAEQMEEIVQVSGMAPFTTDHMARLHHIWRSDFAC
jgi:aryl-alcohol dehydrogenase-like predicted oxidoreductase